MKKNTANILILVFISFLLLFASCSKKDDGKLNDKSKKDDKTTVHKEVVKKVNSYKKNIDKAKKSMNQINKQTFETEELLSNIRGKKKKKAATTKNKKTIKTFRSLSETQSAHYKKANNLKKCIKRVRKKNNDKNLAGSIKYQFEILKSGKVINAKILTRKWTNNKNGKDVEKCILKTISSWRFKEVLKTDKKFIMKSSIVF